MKYLTAIFLPPFSYPLVLLLVMCSFASAAEQPPNVVLIFADDLGYGDLGCYNATKLHTPNIDRIGVEGRRFTDMHSASAVCMPSRYALLTGEYSLRAMGGKGTWGPLSTTSGLIIDTETLTIGKVFKNKGYATACLGKWHLGFKQGSNDWQVPLRPGPQDVCFDHYFGVPLVNSGSPYVYVEDDTIAGYDPMDPLVYGGKPVSPTPTFPEEASAKSPNRFSGALKAHQIFDDEKTGTFGSQLLHACTQCRYPPLKRREVLFRMFCQQFDNIFRQSTVPAHAIPLKAQRAEACDCAGPGKKIRPDRPRRRFATGRYEGLLNDFFSVMNPRFKRQHERHDSLLVLHEQRLHVQSMLIEMNGIIAHQ